MTCEHFPYLETRFTEARALLVRQGLTVEELDSHAFRVKAPKAQKSQLPPQKVLLVALIHGNEIGGVEALYECATEFALNPSPLVELTFVLGNIPAAKLNRRYVERDLNRTFAAAQGQTQEHPLARRIENLVNTADLIIDFHQTVEPSECGFFIFPYSADNMAVAQKIAAENPIVVYREKFSQDGMPLDDYAWTKKVPALTFEMGHLGLHPEQNENVRRVFRRLIALMDGKAPARTLPPRIFSFSPHFIKGAPDCTLIAGFKNFSPVRKGDRLGQNHEGPVVSPDDGFLIFPKYGELAKVSSELCWLMKPVDIRELVTW